MDKLDFGKADSENAHNSKGDFTSVITGFMKFSGEESSPNGMVHINDEQIREAGSDRWLRARAG